MVDTGFVGTAQGVGLAPRQHRRHAGPEELGAERRNERGNADPGDQHAVEVADQNSRG